MCQCTINGNDRSRGDSINTNVEPVIPTQICFHHTALHPWWYPPQFVALIVSVVFLPAKIGIPVAQGSPRRSPLVSKLDQVDLETTESVRHSFDFIRDEK